MSHKIITMAMGHFSYDRLKKKRALIKYQTLLERLTNNTYHNF